MTAVVDVLIPARGGSVGLPGKNVRPLVDRPLLAHSVACARLVPSVRRILVSTDDPDIAVVASAVGADVPELRPAALAEAQTPMADVVRYACRLLDADDPPDLILLLDPTSPLRDPEAIEMAVAGLSRDPEADGAISVSEPTFNPLWVGVTVDGDRMQRHPMSAAGYARRQDVPRYWRINGSFYLWRLPFARTLTVDWLDAGTFRPVFTRELLSHSIDTLDDFRLVEALLDSGVVTVPWMGVPDDRT